jgi:predicted methyltransferase MtxX (methanogen marker protein 4)
MFEEGDCNLMRIYGDVGVCVLREDALNESLMLVGRDGVSGGIIMKSLIFSNKFVGLNLPRENSFTVQ